VIQIIIGSVELLGNFILWYKNNSEIDDKIYSLVHLIHMIVFLLDGKIYKCVSSGFESWFIVSSYLF
jgi:hypothetical protein